jgi:hypothetical protein
MDQPFDLAVQVSVIHLPRRLRTIVFRQVVKESFYGSLGPSQSFILLAEFIDCHLLLKMVMDVFNLADNNFLKQLVGLFFCDRTLFNVCVD